ncbi:MAG: efflux RND transporter periplasmic adaptor subunit [Candidatus Magasanikbacteria bacterium]|nr:efflux RND transporter periplasmic adaptor subunit [Candidatus Magasanikbacteria bacterium]
MSIKKALWIVGILAVIVGIGIYYFSTRNKESIYTTAKIERGSIVQTVSETGTVKASSEIDLSFLTQGRLTKKYFKIGDKIKVGDILAEIDYSGLMIKRNEALANYDAAQQKVNKLRAGATNSEIAVKQALVDQARIAFDAATNEYARTVDTVKESIAQAEKKLRDLESNTSADITAYEQTVTSAQTTLANTKSTYQTSISNYKDTALVTVDAKNATANTALDVIDRTIKDDDAEDLIGVKSPSTLTNTKSSYTNAVSLGTTAKNTLTSAKINPTEENVKLSIDDSLKYLNASFDSLQYCFSALENSVTSSAFTQSDLDTFKSNISTQKTNVSTAISAVQSSKQSLNDAILAYTTNLNTATENLVSAQAAYNDAVKNARNALSTAKISGDQQKAMSESTVNRAKESWNLAQVQLDELLSPANKYDIALAEAQVRQAQAALDQINRDIDNSIIKSPIDGVVTKMDFEIDEQITVGKPAVSVLGENNYEIEVLISEADIAKMSVEDKAEITLDSFGDDIKFAGQVVFIEPAETQVQDVVYYKVTISFDPRENSVKSGMTANVIITTAEKSDVLIIPSRAIIDKNGDGKITRVLVNEKIEEKSIKTGLQGDGGMTEILSGVNEGDAVVTYVKEEK